MTTTNEGGRRPEEMAMDKIRDEMAGKGIGPGETALGEYLTERLTREPGIAGKLLEKGKTLAGAFASIRDAARKKAVQGFAYVGPDEAFAMTCQYFGIPAEKEQSRRDCDAEQDGRQGTKTARASEAQAVRAIPQALADDGLDLDALLDG